MKNKSLGIAYLLSSIFVFHKQSFSQKFVGKLLILCIHDTFALTAIQERCCKGSQNFCPNQIDRCITHLQPFKKNFNLKVLYWINLNSIVLKRSHKNECFGSECGGWSKIQDQRMNVIEGFIQRYYIYTYQGIRWIMLLYQ